MGAPGLCWTVVLGVPRQPLRHPSRRRQRRVLDAPRRAFGDRPLIGRQGLRHAIALLRLLVLRPFGPRRELLPLHELLPLARGVPPAHQSLHYALSSPLGAETFPCIPTVKGRMLCVAIRTRLSDVVASETDRRTHRG